jgi:hypothetical protein
MTRRAIDKRRRAHYCFRDILSPSPPPPPTATSDIASAQANLDLEEERRVNGETADYGGAPKNEAELYAEEVRGTIDETGALIKTLGGTNPILRDLLANAIGEMEQSVQRVSSGAVSASEYFGRRLMIREIEFSTTMKDSFVSHPIMQSDANGGYGREGIPADRAACQAICEALSVTANASNPEECRAFAFRKANPFSFSDFGRCYLLKDAGSCKVEDFAAELFTRHIESEEQCHALRPGNDNPLCVSLPASRIDTRVLTHADAAAIAAQVPTPTAPGAGGLPSPRTSLEAA